MLLGVNILLAHLEVQSQDNFTLISQKLTTPLHYIYYRAMSDISPFYFTLTIHLMAILMVVSAIQFIGVACLMNHVILLLRPLKMKDWLLCGIKSVAVSKMNFASECTPSATEEEDRGCSPFIPWTALLCWTTLQQVTKNNGQLYTTQQLLHSSCTNRDQKMWCHITVCCRQAKTHKRLCGAECRISSLEGSIHKAFSWYYITAFSEPQILHKYWKSTEGIVTQTTAFHTIIKLHCFRATDIAPYCATQWGERQYC